MVTAETELGGMNTDSHVGTIRDTAPVECLTLLVLENCTGNRSHEGLHRPFHTLNPPLDPA